MPQRPYVIDQMISAKSIAARIEELSHVLQDEFNGTDKLVVVGLYAARSCLLPTLYAS